MRENNAFKVANLINSMDHLVLSEYQERGSDLLSILINHLSFIPKSIYNDIYIRNLPTLRTSSALLHDNNQSEQLVSTAQI